MKPASSLKSVVFPQPLGPRNVTNVLSRRVALTSLRARWLPNRFVTPWISTAIGSDTALEDAKRSLEEKEHSHRDEQRDHPQRTGELKADCVPGVHHHESYR